MSRKIKKKGQTDVKAIVLGGSTVQTADCINILNTKCRHLNDKPASSYYELDNDQKYSVCQNPYDDYIYAKAVYFSWESLIILI